MKASVLVNSWLNNVVDIGFLTLSLLLILFHYRLHPKVDSSCDPKMAAGSSNASFW